MDVVTLDNIPAQRELPDGSLLLAETECWLDLEHGRVKHAGSYVAKRTVRLLRRKGGSFALCVLPLQTADGDGHPLHELSISSPLLIKPALKLIGRAETHFIKPPGESLVHAIAANTTAEELRLFCFEVSKLSPNPLFRALRLKRQAIRLCFESAQEASGWYVYLTACATLPDACEHDFRKVLAHHQPGLTEHAANTRALILGS